ncbi:phosphatase [Desulfosarcina alkanivorans]|uniref:Phosphatase n=1 Tax=Desulfosarcina alkanivorans TaxID=571177 RepID=A0A5K7Z1N6_9BACT|nr:DUF1015 domain-containing protein [Desulfosarcina alkanivorans]BBO72404.1 phosphatase [Desulfosarcina alkanivorans]
MATVKPLKGILYNQEKISDHADVTAPPYDVISPEEQDAYYDRHPNNVIRLILNRAEATDTPRDNIHTRSAGFYRKWVSEGILKRDEQDALYLKAITYPTKKKAVTRYGLVARVGIESFEKRIILPHEKTFSKVKSERLELLKATQCNYCPIFSLYPDDGSVLKMLEQAAGQSAPIVDFKDEKGHRHQLWRIIDPVIHSRVAGVMKDKRLFIADGHHRYETAMNFKKYLQDTDPGFSDRHPANYVLMYLCSMSDPGLVILPAHRLIKALSAADMQEALKTARTYFEIAEYPYTPDDRQQVEQTFLADLSRGASRQSIGIYVHGTPVFHLLNLKEGVMERLYGNELDASLRVLDVTVLTRLVFMKILGFDQARLDNEQLIGYASTADEALRSIDTGAYDAAFILNPTRIEQVQEVARKGLIMPRKSTYFFPKVKSGLVMNTLAE